MNEGAGTEPCQTQPGNHRLDIPAVWRHQHSESVAFELVYLPGEYRGQYLNGNYPLLVDTPGSRLKVFLQHVTLQILPIMEPPHPVVTDHHPTAPHTG